MDKDGNLFVSGWSTRADGGEDYATVKYAPDGTQLWVQRFHSVDTLGAYRPAPAVDQAGNVYVAGRTPGAGTGADYATVKYAPNGTQLWVRRYNGPGNGHDQAMALAVDQAGNVYVTGESWGTDLVSDYATVKYVPVLPGLPDLSLRLNRGSFRPGDTQVLTATVTPGATSRAVDAYVAVRLPDGTLLFYPSLTTTLQPVVTNWTVAPFDGELFRYTFSGGEPVGGYAWLAAFTEPGTLNFIGPIVSAPFTFGP